MLQKIILVIVLIPFFYCPAAFAQTNAEQQPLKQVRIGAWRLHLPYNFAKSVEKVRSTMFCATSESLFEHDLIFGATRTYSKVDGLSDVGISFIKYSPEFDILIISYENGNLDLFETQKGRFTNINFIKNSNRTGSKRINHIHLKNGLAYLSCDFGIVELDLARKEIKNTFIIGPNGTTIATRATTTDDTKFYVATELGMFWANINAPNLSDFNAWQLDSRMRKSLNFATTLNGRLYTSRIQNDTIWNLALTTNTWSAFVYEGGIRSISVSDDHLVVTNSFRAAIFDKNFVLKEQIGPESFIKNPSQAHYDKGLTFIADNGGGLIRHFQNVYQVITPNGPYSSNVQSITKSKNNIWVASGGIDDARTGVFSIDGFFSFKDNTWKSVNRLNTNNLDGFFDYVYVKQNPLTKKIYVASWYSGLFEFGEDLQVQRRFTPQNSSLQYQNSSSDNIRVGAVDFDSKGNLWATNYNCNSPVSVLRTNNTWQAYRYGNNDLVKGIFIDQNDQKWINYFNEGLLLINKDNPSIYRLLGRGQGNGNLPSGLVNAVAEDRDGYIWIGTAEGACVFYTPQQLFASNAADAQQPIIEIGGFNGKLLAKETVTSIAIDGANNKWFGTQNGVFVLSADISKQLAYFTAENSPLPSNNIVGIAIDDQTGEVFIGTDKGVASYRGSATIGSDRHENVLVFPNPVRPNYEGVIAISGLVDNAFIKITDVVGNLVYQSKAQGGQAVWNGKDYTGRRVNTGVYLVLSMDETGVERFVSKILFMN